jgi:hypothetical protein
METNQFSFERLDAWKVALDVVALCDQIVRRIPRPYGELTDQLRRASLSIVANLAEGVGKEGKDQIRSRERGFAPLASSPQMRCRRARASPVRGASDRSRRSAEPPQGTPPPLGSG